MKNQPTLVSTNRSGTVKSLSTSINCVKIPTGPTARAEALPDFSIPLSKMTGKIEFIFDKPTISKSIVELLSKGLVDDTENPVFKLTFEECLKVMTQGKKLQNAPANYLLYGLMRALSIEDSPIEDEIPPEGLQEVDLGKDQSLSQSVAAQSTSASPASQSQSLTDESLTEESDDTIHGSTDGASSSSPDTSKAKNGTANKPEKESKSDKSDKVDKSDKKTKALCRFYNNGKCKYNADCRFLHPKVCPKFRQHGDCKTKGCQGGCEFLHPNVCPTSLKDRTCTYPECRFFHLKGTKVIERRQNSNADSQNWRTKNKNDKPQGQNQGQNQRGTNKTPPKNASKNRQASLNARTKKKTPNPKQETVTLEEKKQLGQTLEAIMKRLDAMEAKPIYYPHPGMQMHPQVQPLMSPAVPQPGTQTQFQWASQAPWTPSQTQNSR